MVLGTGKCKIKGLEASVPGPGELLPPGLQLATVVLCRHMGWGERERVNMHTCEHVYVQAIPGFSSTSYKDTFCHSDLTVMMMSKPNCFPKAPPLNTVTGEVGGFNIQILKGHNSEYSSVLRLILFLSCKFMFSSRRLYYLFITKTTLQASIK